VRALQILQQVIIINGVRIEYSIRNAGQRTALGSELLKYITMDSPSKYGGLAAGAVLGTGLLIMGFSLSPETHERAISLRWAGAAVLVFTVMLAWLGVAGDRARALFFTLVSAACSTRDGRGNYDDKRFPR
jgi:hypothetical protein